MVVFPHDLFLPVCRLAEQQYDIVHWTEFEHGEHFPAMEVPDLFVEDIQNSFVAIAKMCKTLILSLCHI